MSIENAATTLESITNNHGENAYACLRDSGCNQCFTKWKQAVKHMTACCPELLELIPHKQQRQQSLEKTRVWIESDRCGRVKEFACLGDGCQELFVLWESALDHMNQCQRYHDSNNNKKPNGSKNQTKSRQRAKAAKRQQEQQQKVECQQRIIDNNDDTKHSVSFACLGLTCVFVGTKWFDTVQHMKSCHLFVADETADSQNPGTKENRILSLQKAAQGFAPLQLPRSPTMPPQPSNEEDTPQYYSWDSGFWFQPTAEGATPLQQDEEEKVTPILPNDKEAVACSSAPTQQETNHFACLAAVPDQPGRGCPAQLTKRREGGTQKLPTFKGPNKNRGVQSKSKSLVVAAPRTPSVTDLFPVFACPAKECPRIFLGNWENGENHAVQQHWQVCVHQTPKKVNLEKCCVKAHWRILATSTWNPQYACLAVDCPVVELINWDKALSHMKKCQAFLKSNNKKPNGDFNKVRSLMKAGGRAVVQAYIEKSFMLCQEAGETTDGKEIHPFAAPMSVAVVDMRKLKKTKNFEKASFACLAKNCCAVFSTWSNARYHMENDCTLGGKEHLTMTTANCRKKSFFRAQGLTPQNDLADAASPPQPPTPSNRAKQRNPAEKKTITAKAPCPTTTLGAKSQRFSASKGEPGRTQKHLGLFSCYIETWCPEEERTFHQTLHSRNRHTKKRVKAEDMRYSKNRVYRKNHNDMSDEESVAPFLDNKDQKQRKRQLSPEHYQRSKGMLDKDFAKSGSEYLMESEPRLAFNEGETHEFELLRTKQRRRRNKRNRRRRSQRKTWVVVVEPLPTTPNCSNHFSALDFGDDIDPGDVLGDNEDDTTQEMSHPSRIFPLSAFFKDSYPV